MVQSILLLGCIPGPCLILLRHSSYLHLPLMKELGVREQRRGIKEGKLKSPFESGFFELRVWGKFLWILI